MSKAGKQMISALEEVAAMARGELSAHSITMHGRTYVPIEEWRNMTMRAIEAEARVEQLEAALSRTDLSRQLKA